MYLCSCSNVFFYPQKDFVITPSEIGLLYQELSIPTSDGIRLHGWHLPAVAKERGNILFLHGNAQNISYHLASVSWLPTMGFSVMLFDYRGYGKSEGDLSLSGIIEDVQSMIAFACNSQTNYHKNLTVFGQSIGGALAVHAVATTLHRPCIQHLVIDSAFADYRQIVREKISNFFLFRPVTWPLSFLVSNEYSPENFVKQISPIPLLIIHGDADNIVPVSHADQLYAKAEEPKVIWKIAGADHIRSLTSVTVRERLLNIIAIGQVPSP